MSEDTTTKQSPQAPRQEEENATTGVLEGLIGHESSFFDMPSRTEAAKLQAESEQRLLGELQPLPLPTECRRKFGWLDLAGVATDAAQVLVRDEFTSCFESSLRRSWNWNVYLFPTWVLGVVARYCVLLPLRAFGLLIGTIIVFSGISIIHYVVRNPERRNQIFQKLVMLYAYVWVMSWSGVVYFHGTFPVRKRNQVFVANHTTIFDIVLLMQHCTYSIVGQKQPGGIGFFQDHLLNSLGIWFERRDANDRAHVSRILKEHIRDTKKNPLLMFPEGVCVNNEYCIMFKKGAFELSEDVEVCPIAIKYNKLFCDAYWNSKEQSFARHVFNLLTSWAVVCDVWYLEPQKRLPGETASAFAHRVQGMVAHKAGLKNTDWDGYLKHFAPSARLAEARQAEVRSSLLRVQPSISPAPTPLLQQS